ncbi:hypothetical protein [Agrobacterium vitis]|uniref:hypothetical protein n=1 Tax=Agrobacterium vitis TaxID=373 RepID=UPI0015723BEA|nr:hypothetical protein [Agrobacterium vitis]NSY12391.1 hypothetical protein [Agrobacterium vitis]NSY22220.1 hypothetical protein [Agrobacterium vitis]NTA21921.1 hypothetical protein [Agrobacterium vitis]WEO70219.1 hypothetical protein G6L01_009340 [Agrobacterium vitis]
MSWISRIFGKGKPSKAEWEIAVDTMALCRAADHILPDRKALSFYVASLDRSQLLSFGDFVTRTIQAEGEVGHPVRQMLAETSENVEGLPPKPVLDDFAAMSKQELLVLYDLMEAVLKYK